jgi:O-antigen/teichoic acid export membrane protein
MGIKRSLVKGGGVAFILNGVGKFLALAAQVIIARWLGTQDYGAFSYMFNLVVILTLLSQLGLHVIVVRQVAVWTASQEWGKLRGVLHISNGIAWTVGLVFLVLGELLLWMFSSWFEHNLRLALQLGLPLIPILVVSQLRQQALRGLKLIAYHRLPEILIMPVVLIVGGTILSRHDFGLPSAVLLQIGAALIGLYVGTFILKRMLPPAVHTARPEYDLRSTLASSIPLLIASSSLLVLNKLDILLLGYFAYMSDVGVYSAVVRLALIVTFGLDAVNAIAGPMIAEVYSDGDKDKLHKMASLSSLGATIFAICIGLIYLIWGRDLLLLFGPQFTTGLTALWILSIGQLINSFTGSVGILLTMTGNERIFSKIMLYSALIAIGLHLILIPHFGIIGASAATSSSIALRNLWTASMVYKHLNVVPVFIG